MHKNKGACYCFMNDSCALKSKHALIEFKRNKQDDNHQAPALLKFVGIEVTYVDMNHQANRTCQ